MKFQGQKDSTSLISELMGIKFKTVTKIAEEGVDEAPKVETSEELSLSVSHSISKQSFILIFIVFYQSRSKISFDWCEK